MFNTAVGVEKLGTTWAQVGCFLNSQLGDVVDLWVSRWVVIGSCTGTPTTFPHPNAPRSLAVGDRFCTLSTSFTKTTTIFLKEYL